MLIQTCSSLLWNNVSVSSDVFSVALDDTRADVGSVYFIVVTEPFPLPSGIIREQQHHID